MSDVDLSSENREWIAAFWATHGHAPRVLHVGNIANNAYNNAKLLNAAGLDCDVICYDYYHMMACPEWEDADFQGHLADHFRPDWTTVNLNGFRRPEWFAQGPVQQCMQYLVARRSKNVETARHIWTEIGVANRTQLPASVSKWSMAKIRLRALASQLTRILRVLAADPYILRNIDVKFDALKSAWPSLGGIAALAIALPIIVIAVGIRLATLPFDWLGRSITRRRVDFIRDAFSRAFPDRPDRLTVADVKWLERLIPLWRKVFQHYDIVQAYSTDPILPLLADKEYFAFEHGTLRDIPLEPTPRGRMTAVSYKFARHVFVTNFDCLDHARALADNRFTLINHPYDEDHGLDLTDWDRIREDLCPKLDASVLFFFPTRHDWVVGTGFADKANDVFLRAFVRLRQHGARVGLVCCRWGTNVPESMRLLSSQDCGKYVEWVEPLGMVNFDRMARACHCVVDQFKLGAFGGVLFKAMAIGAPVCTYLDERLILRQYPVIPPVVNCRSEAEIVDRLTALIEKPDELVTLGIACRDWIKSYHSASMVVNAQLDQYRQYSYSEVKS